MRAVEEHTSSVYWGAALVGAVSFTAGALGGLLVGRLSCGGGSGGNGGGRST